MKPLNRAERNSAFWRFLLLFVITIALVVAVIFFSIEVPKKENDRLRDEVQRMKDEKDFSDDFAKALQDASDELKTFENNNGLISAKHQKVQFIINDMNRMLEKIPNGKNSIYALIVQNVEDLNNTKKQQGAVSPSQ